MDDGVLTGDIRKTASSGSVTSAVKAWKPGTRKIVAFGANLEAVESTTFTVSDSKYIIKVTGPSNLDVGNAGTFTANFLDLGGNTYSTSDSITLALYGDDPDAELSGTTTQSASSGSASFSLSITKEGTYYIYPDVPGIIPEPQKVVVSSAGQPDSTDIQVPETIGIGVPFSVTVRSMNGGSVRGTVPSRTVTLGGPIQGPHTTTNTNGEVIFSNVYISPGTPEGTNAITVNDGSLTGSATVRIFKKAAVIYNFPSQPHVRKDIGTFDYGIKLSTQPTSNVGISLSSNNVAVSVTTPSLTFTTADYNTEQTVTLTVNSGSVSSPIETIQIQHSLSSSDTFYTSASNVGHEGCDNVDSSGILTFKVSENSMTGTLEVNGDFVVELGSSVTFDIKLTVGPSSDVTIGLSSGTLDVSPSSVTFTSANWNTPQTITCSTSGISMTPSTVSNPTISYSISSTDESYSSASFPNTQFLVYSTQSPFAGIKQSAYPIIKEDGSSTYTLQLLTTPSNPVTISLTPSGAISVSPNPVTLSDTTPQLVTVTHASPGGTSRNVVEYFTITHSASSSDTDYDSISRYSIGEELPVYVVIDCEFGKYSDETNFDCVDCPEGYECPNPGTKTACTGGEYSPVGYFTCLKCPAGYDCSSPTTGITQCDSGAYSLSGQTSCTDCPSGFACPDPAAPPVECPLGTYSGTKQTSCTALSSDQVGMPDGTPSTCSSGQIPSALRTHCEDCPPGFACNDPKTRTMTPCPEGHFSAPGSSSCTVCPAGHACSRVEDLGTCPDGYYSFEGWSSCVVCPSGSSCSGGSVTSCAGGEFKSGASSCDVCPANYYCEEGLPPLPCPPGHVSPSGQNTCDTCASGTYEDDNQCKTCPGGYFCPTPVSPPIPCHFGTYSTGSATQCTPCSDGSTCSQGSSSATEINCPGGFFCTSADVGGDVQVTWPKPCPPGTYSNSGATTSCTQCLQGYYCPGNTIDYREFPCPPGHYCTAGSSLPTPCNAGKYNPDWMSNSVAACLDCGAGYFCEKGSPRRNVCPPGHYCAGANSESPSKCGTGKFYAGVRATAGTDCEDCPKGYFCREGRFLPEACPPGTYRSTTGATQETDCTECTAGSVCPLPGKIEVQLPCKPGHYCEAGTAFPTACPGGTIDDATNFDDVNDCSTPCPAGYACPTGASYSNRPIIPCKPGHYCEAGTAAGGETACPQHTYSDKKYLKASGECTPCPSGYYCPVGSTQPIICSEGKYCVLGSGESNCPAGTYMPYRGATHEGECIECPLGHKCTAGSVLPEPCGSSKYADEKGLSDCKDCIAGYYCPSDSNIDPIPCGKGYFSGASASGCTDCDAGKYCPLEATSEATKESNTCPAGLYCPVGTDHYPTNLRDRCQKGHYCTPGTALEIPCSAGRVRRLPGAKDSSDCIEVEAGYYASGTGNWEATGKCNPGYYCPQGSTTNTPSGSECPDGTFRSILGGKSSSDCGECPAGYYCPAGTSEPIICGPGKYCPAGSSSETDCPKGTYSPGEGMFREEDCIDCPPGKYCNSPGITSPNGDCTAGYYCEGKAIDQLGRKQAGDPTNPCPAGGYCPAGTAVKIPCPVGKYLPTGGHSNDSSCQDCPGGKYCAGASDTPSGDCRAGCYCDGGASTECEHVAGEGKFTEAGADSESDCDPGTYNPAKGQSTCPDCPAGFYCPSSGMTAPTVCDPGHYCPAKSTNKTPCPKGTYNPFNGLKAESECFPCPSGYACTSAGMTAVTNSDKCDVGYWCLRGAESKTPSDDSADPPYYGICPLGHYCLQGSGAPTPCPPGKFNSNDESTAPSSCGSCTAGSYCEGLGNSGTTGQCKEGFYCPSGSKIENPNICTPGNKCPVGSSSETPCPAGTYQPNHGQGDCIACPAGYFCPQGSTDFVGNDCPTGHYCPQGTQSNNQNPCPAGTYNPETNAIDDSFCLECPPGKYCSGTGQDNHDGNCDGGYYCKGKATTATPTDGTTGNRCTQGNYCPAGSSAEISCEAGKYCSQNGLSAPEGDCDAGYYCPTGSTSKTQNDCPAGSYCEPGSQSPTPCPAGKKNPNPRQTSLSACVECDAGKYCEASGSTTETGNCAEGWYCVAGSKTDKPQGAGCDKGYKCPAGVSVQSKCTAGSYQSRTLQGSCETCPEGYYCDGTDTTTYVICPAGKYCGSGVSAGTDCDPGKYNPKEGRTDVSACLDCPAGNYCAGSGNSAVSGACTAGYYCTSGSDSATQNQCTVGNYCPGGSSQQIPCDPGKYCSQNGLSAPEGDCDAGYYCTAGSDSKAQTQCTPGNYCEAGSSSQTPCPIGTYNPDTGSTSDSACQQCDAGWYCDELAMTTHDKGTNKCAPGFYCQAGSITPKPKDTICPVGNECPEGSSAPTPCPEGTYSNVEGLESCISCPPGFYCDGGTDQPVKCPAGYFCTGGKSSSTKEQCGLNTYNKFEGQSTCTNCPVGFKCDSLGMTSPVICPAGYYCPGGGNPATLCPDGTYSEITGLQAADDCKPCPPGKYCTNGVQTGDCDPGYYCVSGNKVPNPDGTDASVVGMPCPVGHYCLVGTTLATPCPFGKFTTTPGASQESDCQDCTAGFYCIPGDPNPYDCPRGSYCPTGSELPTDCPAYTYSDVYKAVSEDTCKVCPKGYLCDEEGIGDYKRYPCTAGHYCPSGTQEYKDCGSGTWGPIHALGSAGECWDCPSGSYCGVGAVTVIPCSDWKWCPTGSSSEGDCPSGYYCHQNTTELSYCYSGYYCPSTQSGKAISPPYRCEEGSYCPVGSGAPIECPAGSIHVTYSQRKVQIETCVFCQAGYYANKTSVSCEKCYEGYVCEKGASRPDPRNLETDGGYPCPAGYYCPEATAEPKPCGVGTYNPNEGAKTQEECLPCNARTYNDQEGQPGCFPCGPNAFSETGQSSCSCYGKFRSYMKRDATCRCQPGYQFFKDGTQLSDEDSRQDCVPVVLENCADGQVRDALGNCRDKNSCEDECQGGSGERSPDLGLCLCDETPSIQDVCDENCRTQTPTVTLTSDGIFRVSDPNYYKDQDVDFQSTPGYTGRVYCYEDKSCKVSTIEFDADGSFTSNYEPSLVTQYTESGRRRLQSDLSLKNPVFCLQNGETMVFSVIYPNHYPVYLKDSLLNNNPNFDYGPFMELKQLIEDGKQNITTFGYTFREPGTYAFGDSSDSSKVLLVNVKNDYETCEEPYIKERRAGTLSQSNVAADEEVTTSTDWLIFGFLFVIFVLFIVFIVFLQVFNQINMKSTQKRNMEAYRQMIKSQNAVVKQDASVIGDNEATGALNPEVFQGIHQKLLDLNHLIKQRMKRQAQLENDLSNQAMEALMELKNVLSQIGNPRVELPASQESKQLRPMEVQVLNPKQDSTNNRTIEKIQKDPQLTQEEKNQLLEEFNGSLANLEAQMAEDRVHAETSLKARLEERNRRRKELLSKKEQLETEELQTRESHQKAIRDLHSVASQVEREYEKEKRRARENVFGNTARNMRKEMLDNIKKNPEKEQEFLDQYEKEMNYLEKTLGDEKGRQHRELMQRIEQRRNSKLEEVEENAKQAAENHSQKVEALNQVNKSIEVLNYFSESGQSTAEHSDTSSGVSDSEQRSLERKYKDQQKQLDLQHDNKKSKLEKEKHALTANLSMTDDKESREKLLDQINSIDKQLQNVQEKYESEQKKLLTQRLQERRKLRRDKAQQAKEKQEVEESQKKKQQTAAQSQQRLKKLEEAIKNLPENQQLEMVKELLADKHDQELMELQAQQQGRSTNIHSSQLRETLENKSEALKAAKLHLADLSEEKQQQAINSILLEGEQEAQKDFENTWQDHKRKCNEELLELLDKQMQEVQETLQKLGFQDELASKAKALAQDFEKRKANMENESKQRMIDLEKQREELEKLAKAKQQELEEELAASRKRADLERAKRELEERQRKEREEAERKGQMTQRQIDALISQHKKELEELEGALSQEKQRQQESLKNKLQEKRERKRKALQVPTEMKQFNIDTAKKLKAYREAEHTSPEIDDDLFSELLRRIARIEKIMANVDTNQTQNVLSALQALNDQLNKLN